MKFTKPSVEWWPQTTVAQQIAKVGRICYKSKEKQPSPDLDEEAQKQFIENEAGKLCDRFWRSGHRSMYRHGTVYFYIKHSSKLPHWIWSFLAPSPYIDYATAHSHVWISTNMQFLCEHGKILALLKSYEVSEAEFIAKAIDENCDDALTLLRMTMVVTTQISTSRELNRTSPNAISEQSTRYVNLQNKGGVQLCIPHWWEGDATASFPDHIKFLWQKSLYRIGCKVSEWVYVLLLKSGMKPQDARGILPLDAYTVVAYTYSLADWHHILDLRYRGKTGAPHPNAKIIGEQIHDIICNRMRTYKPDFDI